jgi:sn-glycerol 3-phosphate transport system permease protein
VQQQDAFGTSVEWVGLENFQRPVRRPHLPGLVQDHRGVLVLVALLGLTLSLLLAVMADRVVKGSRWSTRRC